MTYHNFHKESTQGNKAFYEPAFENDFSANSKRQIVTTKNFQKKGTGFENIRGLLSLGDPPIGHSLENKPLHG